MKLPLGVRYLTCNPSGVFRQRTKAATKRRNTIKRKTKARRKRRTVRKQRAQKFPLALVKKGKVTKRKPRIKRRKQPKRKTKK